MSIVKKAPGIMTREVKLEEPVNELLEDYARFIESNADHVVNAVLKKVLWRDQDYRKWREARRTHSPAPTKDSRSKREGGPDAKNTRIARLHLGHPRHGRRYVPFLHAPFPRRADFHLAIPRLLDRAFGPLHLYFESPPDHLARTPSQVSRSQ